ncbi:MAG: hypothetical protein KTR27_12510 [Leptolyngbyaceae cyanobacterium MAG.088]|nr:hypothetical protein [Leptolyngbyaceae cyanobacterium MAG.088]
MPEVSKLSQLGTLGFPVLIWGTQLPQAPRTKEYGLTAATIDMGKSIRWVTQLRVRCTP